MDQAQLLSVIGSMYDKLVADVTTRVEANLIHIIDQSIDVRIKAALDPMGLESGVIREIVQAELKSKIDNLDIDMYISDWMGCNFDISDYEHNLEIEDKISDWMDSNLTDRVRDEVRELSFSVTVD